VSIEVWDTGPGITAEKCTEIFQEFTQLGNPERDRRKGLGLGLAIVERLAKLLGHSVLLRSRVGKGSVFAVSVARAHEEAIPEPVARRVAGHFDLRGRLVLLIQSAPVVREELTDLLRSWSCEVVAAGSLAEMMGMLRGLPRAPDLVISERDAHADGGVASVELLRNEFNFEVPALLVGLSGESAGSSGDARGGLPVLHWPCNAARLRTLVSYLLHGHLAAAPVPARRAS